MTETKSNSKDHNFGSFAMGVAIGVVAVLLFGTEEGKKLTSNLFDALPDKLKSLTDNASSLREESISNDLIQEPESTPHSYIYNQPTSL